MNILVALLIATITCTVHAQGKQLDYSDTWIREAPPTAHMLAAYGTLTNNSDQAIIVTAANSEAFEHVEIHQTVIDDGIARMKHHESVEILPGKSLVFAPNGYHWMLIRPKHPIAANDSVNITLIFDDGTRQQLPFEVRGHTTATDENRPARQ